MDYRMQRPMEIQEIQGKKKINLILSNSLSCI